MTLGPSPFTDKMCLRPPTIIHELRLRTTDYIQVKEIRALRSKFRIDVKPNERRRTNKMLVKTKPRC